MKSRVNKIFQHTKKELDAIVFANATEPHIDMSFFYVTGIEKGIFEGGAAVLKPEGSLSIITSVLELESAKRSRARKLVFKDKAEREKAYKKALRGCKRIGVNADELTYGSYKFLRKNAPKGARFVDVSKAVQEARKRKDKKELETMREACRIASKAADDIRDFIKPGVKEYEVAAELCYIMQKQGATGPSFETIASFGPNTAEPHYSAGNRVLKKNDTVLLDFGAVYNRYCSDITRTYYVGKASKKQKDMYNLIREAQQIALDLIRHGENGMDVDKAVRKHIDSSKFKGLFIHSTGHGLGLSVHDPGSLSHKLSNPLENGMVLTVEPGVYISGYGGVRIEDDIVVRKGKPEVLTTASRELFEL